MRQVDAKSFGEYLGSQWSGADFSVTAITDAPYKELNRPLPDGWSLGLGVARAETPNQKARVGVWFRPAPKGSINDLANLRTHYQQKLAQQGRGCRILNCGIPAGTIFLFFETTAPLAQADFGAWTKMAEELAGLAFDGEALDGYLGVDE
jgi:hypothetical protein